MTILANLQNNLQPSDAGGRFSLLDRLSVRLEPFKPCTFKLFKLNVST